MLEIEYEVRESTHSNVAKHPEASSMTGRDFSTNERIFSSSASETLPGSMCHVVGKAFRGFYRATFESSCM